MRLIHDFNAVCALYNQLSILGITIKYYFISIRNIQCNMSDIYIAPRSTNLVIILVLDILYYNKNPLPEGRGTNCLFTK